jgi:hypothetical protein
MHLIAPLLDPSILFFLVGIAAGLVGSNLEIPKPISRFITLFLLMAIGLKGGWAMREAGLSLSMTEALLAAVMFSVVTPLVGYIFLARVIDKFNAAAIAAAYGSVSAVTFITAIQFLESRHIDFGGYMAVALVLMESPAIIIAVMLASRLRQSSGEQPVTMKALLHEAFTDGAQFLLLGSLFVGYVSGEKGQMVMAPFSADLFKGMLAFFLLDMGMTVAANLGGLRKAPLAVLAYGIVAPFLHATLALFVAKFIGLSLGDALLLAVLAAGASYIAVPAVVRTAIPEANPSLYFGMALGLTFPFNVLVGIPLYYSIAQKIL